LECALKRIRGWRQMLPGIAEWDATLTVKRGAALSLA
jgi:hypothetical protein